MNDKKRITYKGQLRLLTSAIYDDIDEVLLYLWEDEHNHYLAHPEDSDGHIFEAVKRVRAWLDGWNNLEDRDE